MEMKTKHVDLGPLPNNLSIRAEQMEMRYEQGGQFSFDKWTGPLTRRYSDEQHE